MNAPAPPAWDPPRGCELGALMAPHCVVWDPPLPSQLSTAEKLKHTDKTKWCLQRNVNVCTRHLQKQADGFPSAPALPIQGAGSLWAYPASSLCSPRLAAGHCGDVSVPSDGGELQGKGFWPA